MTVAGNANVLIIDDDRSVRSVLLAILSREGFRLSDRDSFQAGLAAALAEPFDLILCDVMLGDGSGLALIERLKEEKHPAEVIVMTGHPSLQSAQEAIRQGAFDYLDKPVSPEVLRRTAHGALRHKRLRDEKERLRLNLEAVFRSVPNGLITVDAAGVLLSLNDAAQRICGLSAQDIGMPLPAARDLCAMGCLQAMHMLFATRQAVDLGRVPCHHQGRSGQMVSVIASPLLDATNAFTGAVMVVEDNTRLAALERDLNQRAGLHRLIGASPAMQPVYDLIENLADVESTALISGETGTGKELVAEAIHHRGRRGNKPLVKVNCAALTETLLESELFGHRRGAFTGALSDKEGRFQAADGGTLFLDEIGDISPAMQLRLLRVLQEKEFERVGDSRTIKVDVRVVAATNRHLKQRVQEGHFREDLYYRLRVVEVRLPALRERREDIPLLVEHFLTRFNERFGKQVQGLSQAVLATFMDHPWPGNVRELEHAIEHAFVVLRGMTIEMEHLPRELREQGGSVPQGGLVPKVFPTHARARAPGERERIVEALRQVHGNRDEAAKRIGMSRATFYRRLKKYAIRDGE